MRSENMSKSLLPAYHITKISPHFVNAEHHGDGSFWTGHSINDRLFLRMRTKEIAKSLGKCTPIEKILPYLFIMKIVHKAQQTKEYK